MPAATFISPAARDRTLPSGTEGRGGDHKETKSEMESWYPEESWESGMWGRRSLKVRSRDTYPSPVVGTDQPRRTQGVLKSQVEERTPRQETLESCTERGNHVKPVPPPSSQGTCQVQPQMREATTRTPLCRAI